MPFTYLYIYKIAETFIEHIECILYDIIQNKLLLYFFSIMHKKAHKKFAERGAAKKVQKISGTVFRTHDLTHSEAEIIIPMKFKQYYQEDKIYQIQTQDKIFHAQVSTHSLSQYNQNNDFSILKNIVNFHDIKLETAGSFNGELRAIDQVPLSAQIAFVDILIKQTYFSRRDQYKVMKWFQDHLMHVYQRKILYFDEIRMEVTGIMKVDSEILERQGKQSKLVDDPLKKTERKKQQSYSESSRLKNDLKEQPIRNPTKIVNCGIITKNSKILFRSACAKSTILVEISKETFEMNCNQELYLEKMLQFIVVYLLRNQFYNTKHKLQIVLFARLFYPQFQTLQQAYNMLKNQSGSLTSNDKAIINFAVAFQKDYTGRIYQDAYRRVLWPYNTIVGFSQFFWQKVSEFLFTINWGKQPNRFAHFVTKNISNIIKTKPNDNKTLNNKAKVKPFIHKLKCDLSASKDSNLFQALSLISEQYSNHFFFRSLKQTGFSITVLSAGVSEYKVDVTTYKMAKSYIYLTNIMCTHINFRHRVNKMKVFLQIPKQTARYNNRQDIKRLQKLTFWKDQQKVYQSPLTIQLTFEQDFELKSAIYPQQLIPISEQPFDKKKQFQQFDMILEQNQPHKQRYQPKAYTVKQKPLLFQNVKEQQKQIQWVEATYFWDEAFTIHEYFYDKNIPNPNFYLPGKKMLVSNELGCFQQELKNIIISKKQWYNFNRVIPAKKTCVTPPKKRQQQIQIHSLSKVKENLDHSFEETTKNKTMFDVDEYSAPTQQRQNEQKQQSYIKKLTHNKLRFEQNFPKSNIHYLPPLCSQSVYDSLQSYIIDLSQSKQKKTVYKFELEKWWKKICFPILVPIYTKCEQIKAKQFEVNENQNDFDEQICKFLMANYQILYLKPNKQALLGKGHVNYHIKNSTYIVSRYITDITKQQRSVPYLLYRFLSYQEKDFRFCSKFIYFKNVSFFHRNNQVTYKKDENYMKAIKLFFIPQPQSNKTYDESFTNFIKCLGQQYKQIRKQLKNGLIKGKPKKASGTKTIDVSLSNQKKSYKIYKNQRMKIVIDTQYNEQNLYVIIIQWDSCSPSLLNQFVQTLTSFASRNCLTTHQMTSQDPFNIRWSIVTIAQIIFESKVGFEFMMIAIAQSQNWLWDKLDFFMSTSALSFIKFRPDKKMILWKDNYRKIEKNTQDPNQIFQKFFMLASVFDFVGSMVQQAFNLSQNARANKLKMI